MEVVKKNINPWMGSETDQTIFIKYQLELLSGLNTTSASSPSSANIDDSRDSIETVNDNEDSFDPPAQEAPREQGELDVTSETVPDIETEEYEYEYDDSDYAVEDTDYTDDVDVNFDYNDGSDDVVSDDYEQTEYIDDSQDYLNVDTPVDFPLGNIVAISIN